MPQNKANNIGAFKPINENPIKLSKNNIEDDIKVPLTNLCNLESTTSINNLLSFWYFLGIREKSIYGQENYEFLCELIKKKAIELEIIFLILKNLD